MASFQSGNANRYKGNDIDTDGNGRVAKADHASNASNATAYKGNEIDSNGDGVVDKADTSADRPVPGTNITEQADGTWNVPEMGSPVPAVKDVTTLRVQSNPENIGDPANATISPSGSFVNTGLSMTFDVTNVSLVRFRFYTRNNTGANNYVVRAYNAANGLKSAQNNNSNTSFSWITGDIVDVQALTGTLTFEFQMKNQSSYGDTLEFGAWEIYREERVA